MDPSEIHDQKSVEYYAASVNAWFNSCLEHDKSLFTLSAAGIGLLVTLLTTVGLHSAEALVLYICAINSFLISLVALLIVFKKNRDYIEEIIARKELKTDPVLRLLDRTALLTFGVGVVFTGVIGISAAIHSYAKKESEMVNETIKPSVSHLTGDSFSGVAKLKPDMIKSFAGAANLQPQTPPPAPSTPASSTTQATSPVPKVKSQ